MAWLTAHPINDKIKRNFRPFWSINLYVMIPATNCTIAMQTDDHPNGKFVPEFRMIIDPYVKKMTIPVKLLKNDNIIACTNPYRAFTKEKKTQNVTMHRNFDQPNLMPLSYRYRSMWVQILIQYQMHYSWDCQTDLNTIWGRFVTDVCCRIKTPFVLPVKKKFHILKSKNTLISIEY